MKKEKSLCEICSNRVIIKAHWDDKSLKPLSKDNVISHCFYEFTIPVTNGNYGYLHVANVTVDECSFYNKTIDRLKRKKYKTDTNNDDDTSDDTSYDKRSGVTFTNIPGALLP